MASKNRREKKLNGNPEMKISAQLNTAGRFFYDEKGYKYKKRKRINTFMKRGRKYSGRVDRWMCIN